MGILSPANLRLQNKRLSGEHESAGKETEAVCVAQERRRKKSPPEPPFPAGCFDQIAIKKWDLRDRYPG